MHACCRAASSRRLARHGFPCSPGLDARAPEITLLLSQAGPVPVGHGPGGPGSRDAASGALSLEITAEPFLHRAQAPPCSALALALGGLPPGTEVSGHPNASAWHGCPHQSGQVTGDTGLGQHLPTAFQLPYWCGVLAKLLSGCSLILFYLFILFCLVCCRFFPPGRKTS